MSILAEPRKKNRISVDPQNQQWANDHSKFGKKLMEKMGWSNGEGLGKGGRGRTENLKLKPNGSGKGLGCVASHDNTWVAHHDDFADLLSALNKNKPTKADDEEMQAQKAKQMSLELTSKSLKRRIHYQKFTRAKDLSEYDDNAKKAVMGVGITKKEKETKHDDEEQSRKVKTESQESVENLESNHTVSAVSVGDYFKDKMAARLAALKDSSTASSEKSKHKRKQQDDSATNEDDASVNDSKKKKHLNETTTNEDDSCVKDAKKKKKKRDELIEETTMEEDDCVTDSKRKRKRNEVIEETTIEDDNCVKDSKKKKKHRG